MKQSPFQSDPTIEGKRNRTRYWIIGLILAAILMLLVYPFPSTDFLYRNAGVLKDRVKHLKGASLAITIDPSFYYKFTISPTHFTQAVSALELEKESKASLQNHYVRVMKRGPLSWNFWWWRPRVEPASVLYTGDRNGNHYYFLYDQASQTAYLYIQNT